MASGFPGGGGGGGLPGLYGEVGRSMGGVQIGNSLIGNPSGNHNMNMAMYRFQQQQQMVSGGGGIATDQSQIGGRRPESTTMVGKRSLAQFQSSYTPQSSSSQTNFLLQQRQQQQLAFIQQQQGQGQGQGQGRQQQQFMSSAASLLRHNPHQAQLLQPQHQGMTAAAAGSFLRSVKQRTTATNSYHNHHNTLSPISPLSPSIDLCSPNPNNNSNNNNNNNSGSTSINLSRHHQDPATASCLSSLSSSSSSSSAARLGVPLYHHHSHQQQLRLNQANTCTAAMINNNNNNNQAGSVVNFGSNQGPPPPPLPTIGYSNLCPNRPGSDGLMKSDPDNNAGKKAIMSLEDLEKELLRDDDDDDDFDGFLMGSGDGTEGDAVSVITNSDWSDTFQLLSPTTPQTNNSSITNTTTPVITSPPPPKPAAAVTPTNINTQISPSPTSSSSSSCSSSATPPPPPPPSAPVVSVSVSAKQLISEAVTAISEGKTDDSAEILNRLSQVSNQKGTPEQKLAFYMLHALRCRTSPAENPPPVTELFSPEHAASFQSLCDLSPCFKFPLLAANLAILDTIALTLQESRTQDPASGTGVIPKTRVHIVDFDIGGGDQYTHLLSAVPSSQVHSLELRITAVDVDGRRTNSLEVVRETLVKLAERTGLSFRFDSVACGIPELTPESLGCEEGETLVVNFAYRLYRVPDESVSMENLRDDLLRRVKGMCPRLVTLVEQEMNVNTAPFTSRVSECGAYYAEVIDSLAGGSRGDAVEEGLGRKAANTVACEGRERVERCEVFGKWRARMGMAGFQGRRLTVGSGGGEGQSVAESMRVKLCDPGRGGNPKFVVKEDGLGVCFGWNGRTITVASAWR